MNFHFVFIITQICRITRMGDPANGSRCRVTPPLRQQRNYGTGIFRNPRRTGDRSLLDVSLGCYPLRVSQPLAKTIGVWLSMGLINSAQTVIHLSLNQSLVQTFVSSGNDFRLDRRQPQKPAIPAPESSRPTLPGSGTGNTSCEVHSPGTT